MRFIAICCALLGTPTFADHELDGRNISHGQDLYQAQCAACHGVNLEGQPNWQRQNDDGTLPAPPHDMTGHTWHHDNALLFNYTKLGGAQALAQRGVTGFTSGMPTFEGVLSDEDIWNILAFIHSTWPEQVKAMHATRNPKH